ncbi:MAG: HAMP domain-containing histidine kinase [Deltaproteobacteria bacterium]|nr:HAMP domain-containing histidine kinase [Deltaproteobacteria bacterium]
MTRGGRRIVRALRRYARRARVRVTPDRLRWSVRVRATVIVVFLAVAVAGWRRGVLPALGPALVAAVVGGVMNRLAAGRIARWERIPGMLAWTGAGDAVLITYVVAWTGGAASPFLFLYVVQVLTTAIVVDVGLGAATGAASLALLTAASLAEPAGLGNAARPVAVAEAAVRLASFGTTLLFLVFVGGVLARRLTRSERALAGTHRRLARSLRRLTATHASLRDAYDRLARAEAGLVETDRMKTLQLLVAGMAHELGNPLAVLAGTIEPLTEAVRAYERALALCAPPGAADAPGASCAATAALVAAAAARREAPWFLANCAEATSRATGLLAQLRDFGRGGKGTVRRAAPLAPGLVATLALLRYRVPPGVTVHEDYGEVPPVVCVPAEINQVVINLLMNALDALAPGGNLWLALARDGGDVCLVVRDDGVGIADDLLPSVFEPFVTTKEPGRGSGLGLAISHAIVARHGGRIEIASMRGRGTSVTVRLPAARAAQGTG